ncbi:hypothetical protein MKX08_000002 [Trichoderma sp. CBMAI-0020]|nr:hypothetical protein MKX08_000002 [Trichoderma sp. CBMAI-0020]
MEAWSQTLEAGPPQTDRRSSIPCQFFVQHRCRNGTKCPFSHAANEKEKVAYADPKSLSGLSDATPQRDTRSRISCRFYLRGMCAKNEKCPFAHDNPQDVADSKMEEEDDSITENWCRELKGALVRFGDGAAVAQVSFPSDFSAVRISNLPQFTTAKSVVTLLTSFDFNVPEDCVRISRPTDGSHYSADIRVEDPQFSKRLCELLASKRHGSPIAVPINVSMSQTTNHRRIDSKKVYCSWHKPTKTAWLNFGNGGVAAKVGLKFSAGTYKILDQSVHCEGPTRGEGSRNPLAWTLRLSNVPTLAKKEDITRAIPAAMAPRHVELSTASYDVDLPMANALIESLLLTVGPLERWEGSLEIPGKRFKAKAWFMNDADALQAVKLFHNEPLSFNKTGKLTVQLVHSARFRILARIYDAVEQELAEHKKAWAAQHVLCTAYPPAQGLQVLKIEGGNGGDVARAKTTLERIINGEVLTKDGKPLWAPSFATNGDAYQRIKQLERELGVFIVRDKRKSQLRLLGPQLRREEAQIAVSKLTYAHPISIHVIELDMRQFSWAFKGGYRAMAEAIGNDKVVLDIASSPRRILVVGSKADLNIAREILQREQGMIGEKPEPVSISDCVICWTPADNPIQTTCKHLYCSGCFEDLCFAGVNSGPGIRCQGDAGNCGQVLLLTELQVHLSSTALEDILWTNLSSSETSRKQR